jgi:DNA polymerase-3 subunit gamma/tau
VSTTTPKTQNLAIEHRPKTWGQIVGQEIPVKILVNSLVVNEIKPAYLFMGTTGCGKTTAASVMSKRLVCEAPLDNQDPCNECAWCRGVDRNTCPDVKFIDGASERSVDFVRNTIVPFLTSAPLSGRKRVVVIDEAHLYKTDAISAFLTLLEQLPIKGPKSVVILCTTEGDSIETTIRNRCLPIIFSPIPTEQIAAVMHKHTGASKEVLEVLARECGGSFRTVWSFIDSWQYLGEELTEDLIMKMMGGVTSGDRLALWKDLSAKRLDTAANRWKKWMSNGGSPAVIGKLLVRDAIDFAGQSPDATNWIKVFTLLSGAQTLGSESAWLAALYTMAGLPLVSNDGNRPGPARQAPPTSQPEESAPAASPNTERLVLFGS